MKILPNIIPLIKIKNSLKFPDKYKADIEKYRREGNAEKEREFILKASSVWGKNIQYRFNCKRQRKPAGKRSRCLCIKPPGLR